MIIILFFFLQGAPLPHSECKHLSPVASYHPAILLSTLFTLIGCTAAPLGAQAPVPVPAGQPYFHTFHTYTQGAPLPHSERKHLSPVASYHPAIQLPPINSGGKHLGVGGGSSRLPTEDSGRRQHVAPLFGDEDEAQQLQQQQQQYNDPAAPEMYDSAPPPETYEPSPATEARFHQHALDNTGMLAAFHEPAAPPHHGAAAFLPPLDAPPAAVIAEGRGPAPFGTSPKAQQQRLAVRDLQVGEVLEGGREGFAGGGIRPLGTCRWGEGRGIR